MEGWTRLPRSEAMQKARNRFRQPSANRKAMEDEIRYLNDHPEQSTRIQHNGTGTFQEWYKTTRGMLLRVSREIGIPLTVRQEEGQTGLVFWRATEEELASRPNPQRRPTPGQKAMGVTEDLAEGADEDEIEETQESLAFTCPACEKAFDSERGLNTHKRMAKH
jgi:hypothetical protein